jgi:glycosyltransferase 2 family protein
MIEATRNSTATIIGHSSTAGKAGRRVISIVWTVLAAGLAVGVFLFAFRNIDLARMLRVLHDANLMWIAALVGSIPFEQVVRGWQWRQLLHDIRLIGTLRLFGAVMGGYFTNMVVPVGISPLVRAWLVAKLEGLRIATVLMTTAIGRFVDGMVFAVLTGSLVLFAIPPETEGDLRFALIVAGIGSFALFAALLFGLFIARNRLGNPASLVGRAIAVIERAFRGRLADLGQGIAAGIVWPESPWRGFAVIAASILMKAVATTHFLWAGIAVGILLAPSDYLFLVVFAGFSLIIGRVIRVPGGFVIGSAFALKLLGVPDEEALTMVMLVHIASIATTVGIGAVALWHQGTTVAALRRGLSVDNG